MKNSEFISNAWIYSNAQNSRALSWASHQSIDCAFRQKLRKWRARKTFEWAFRSDCFSTKSAFSQLPPRKISRACCSLSLIFMASLGALAMNKTHAACFTKIIVRTREHVEQGAREWPNASTFGKLRSNENALTTSWKVMILLLSFAYVIWRI